jgi:hypothetical protein
MALRTRTQSWIMALVMLLIASSALAFVPSSTPNSASVDRSISSTAQASSLGREVISSASSPSSAEIRTIDAPTTNSNDYLRNSWVYLPASASRRLRNRELQGLEQTIGRLAMAGAIGIVWKELAFRQSIVEQLHQMMQ